MSSKNISTFLPRALAVITVLSISACAAKVFDDPASLEAFNSYKNWEKVNQAPVLSATHGNRHVYTYINEIAKSAGLDGNLPFSTGSSIVKESFVKKGDGDGDAGPVFIMEKREAGYDPERGDWHYAMLEDGVVRLSGNSENKGTKFCSDCHVAVTAQDYVFGVSTTMQLQ